MTTASIELNPITCANCGLVFGLPKDFEHRRREDHGTFYCPAGHILAFHGETKAERLERDLAATQRRLELAMDSARINAASAKTAEHGRAIVQGKYRRMKARVAAGVCPCCNRTFQNLGRHMKGQHPAFGRKKK